MTTHVTVRLFFGVLLTPELQLLLKQNRSWQNAIAQQTQELITIHHEGKDYLGLYFDQERLLLPTIRQADQKIRKLLQTFCPNFDLEKAKIEIIPQLFVGSIN